MALSTVTVSFDAAQLLGSDFDSRRTKVRVYTNVANQTLIDTAANLIRLGDETVPIASDGTGSFTTWAPGADGNPTSWQTYVAFDYPRTGARDRQTRIFGPYTISATANLADLEEEQAVPPDYLTTITELLQGYVDAAGAYANAFTISTVETLGPGEPATAEIVDGELNLGIPAGDITPAAQAAIDAAVIAAAAAAAGPAAAAATALALGYAEDAAESAAIALAALGEWAETPTPINPSSPTWNDATSQFTAPSGQVGVDYVWTSGGGGVGATVTPGSTVGTTGAFPRSIIITPTPKSGYVLASPSQTFRHDFPDPTTITLLTSDGFSGSAAANFNGRSTDIAAGGTAMSYIGWTALTTGLDRLALDGSGSAIPVTAVGTRPPGIPVVAQNIKIEWDLTSINLNGAAASTTAFSIGLAKATSAASWGSSSPSVAIALGAVRVGATTSVVPGNPDPNITWDSGGVLPAQGVAVPLGHYTLQIFGKTLTFIMPDGVGGYVTRTVWLDPSKYTLGTASYDTTNAVAMIQGANTTQLGTIDNLKISKVGF